ncbi:uncharacterized protein SCHCODRAFT_02516476 [Schizophyllum commune H4-8]|nr:uncharacterized protein SCHCODRAFT_02516476 [Schizophyllum commune H4-8]KAI5887393.1 hypothetical protein SCHCODRAFT_02516476 [Schizophyllum commune H4-8]
MYTSPSLPINHIEFSISVPGGYFDASEQHLEDRLMGWDQNTSESDLLAHVGDECWSSPSVISSDDFAGSHRTNHALSWTPRDFFGWDSSASSFPMNGSELSPSPSILGDPSFFDIPFLSDRGSQGSAPGFSGARNIALCEPLGFDPSTTVSDHAATLTSPSFAEGTPSVDGTSQPIVDARSFPGRGEWPHYLNDNLLTSAVPSSSDLMTASAVDGHSVVASARGQSSGSAGSARRVVATSQQQKAAERRRCGAGGKIYPCPFSPDCKSTFTRRFSAKNHARVHENKQEFFCELGCGSRYNTEALRRRHHKKCARRGAQPAGDGL